MINKYFFCSINRIFKVNIDFYTQVFSLILRFSFRFTSLLTKGFSKKILKNRLESSHILMFASTEVKPIGVCVIIFKHILLWKAIRILLTWSSLIINSPFTLIRQCLIGTELNYNYTCLFMRIYPWHQKHCFYLGDAIELICSKLFLFL